MAMDFGKREYGRLRSEADREAQNLNQLREHGEKLKQDQKTMEQRLFAVDSLKLSEEDRQAISAQLTQAIADMEQQYKDEVHDPMQTSAARMRELAADAEKQAEQLNRLSGELGKIRMQAAANDTSAARTAKERQTAYQELHDDINRRLQEVLSNNSDDPIDFSVSANTASELALLRQIDASGDAQTGNAPPKDLVYRLPAKEKGSFQGAEGNSMFVPSDRGMQKLLEKYGQTGVLYQNMDPDFRPFCTHDTPWGKMECQVRIGHMTGERENSRWDYGRRSGLDSYSAAADAGNFRQADAAMCDAILRANPHLLENRDQRAVRLELCRSITSFRKKNGLSWHECGDGTTMQLIPREINGYFSHTGGTALSGWLAEWGAAEL